MTAPGLRSDLRIALVLGGGNALGAYHAGLCQALDEAGIEPEWIVGTSIGAVTGAIFAGNEPAQRIAQLRKLWRPAAAAAPITSAWWPGAAETARRTTAIVETLLAGRAGLFAPLGSAGMWPLSGDRKAGTPALYDTQALQKTLSELIDFDRLNTKGPRFTLAAVDIETGEEVWIDTQDKTIVAGHIRASAALISTFPAVEIGGRLLADGGLAVNLPLDPVMDWTSTGPVLCLASDLLPLAAPPPRTVGEAIARTQDLMFAAQSRRTIQRWQALFAADPRRSQSSITLVTMTYANPGTEVAGKAMDFSPYSIRERWDAGYRDANLALDRLRSGAIAVGQPGLTVSAV